MTNSPEQPSRLNKAAFDTAAKQQAKDSYLLRAQQRAAAKAAETARISRNRVRAGVGVGAAACGAALAIVVGPAVLHTAEDAFSTMASGLSSEHKTDAKKRCLVINEPLKSRTIWKVAQEKSDKLGLNPENDDHMTKLTNVIQDNGGEGSLPLAEATGMSVTQQIEVKVCVTDPAEIPVNIFSPDGTSE